MRSRWFARPFVGPTRFVWHRVTPGDLGLELTSLVAVLAVGASVLVGLAVELGPNDTTYGDRRTFELARDLSWNGFDGLADVAQALASGPVVAAIVVLVALAAFARRRPVEALGLLGGAAALAGLLELLDGRQTRPGFGGWPDFTAARACAWPAVAVVLARLGGRPALGTVLVTAAVVLAAAIGSSRLNPPAAWLTDVAAGWAVGAVAFAAAGIVALLIGYLRHNGGSRG